MTTFFFSVLLRIVDTSVISSLIPSKDISCVDLGGDIGED